MALNIFPSKPPTDIFTPDDHVIDRRGRGRTVPMRVLVLGLGRTGTASIRQALKSLGILLPWGYEDTYHMMSASVENPSDCILWQQAFAAKYDRIGTFGRKEWDQLLGDCQAVSDWPAIAFSEELLAAYPEAKVILPWRDIDSWYRSVLQTTLIWSGPGDGLASNAYGFHVCNYNGSVANHLCFFQGVQMFGYGQGYGVILDSHYQIVRTFQSQGGSDIHEFALVDDGRRALVTRYKSRVHDFGDLPNPQGLMTAMDGIFTETDLGTNFVTFQWSSLNHIKPVDPIRPLELENGQAPVHDYFHINSVVKNRDGDYLVTARHTSAVYKVSGADGHVIWQLSNGPDSTFTFRGFMIWGPHHARYRSENQSHSIITLFNNGYNGVSTGANQSSGMVIMLDHTSFQATLLREYGSQEQLGSVSKGSFQTLSNSNIVIGWGSQAHITEYLDDGTQVFNASFVGGGDTYRVFKDGWTGHPVEKPDLWVYARTAQAPIVLYVSWNGATEVHGWRFYLGNGPITSNSSNLAGFKVKDGFETNFTSTEYATWAFAEAVSADGVSLRNSSKVMTWSPGEGLNSSCDEMQCFEKESYSLVRYNLLPDLSGLGAPAQPDAGRLEGVQPLEPKFNPLFIVFAMICGVLSIGLCVRAFVLKGAKF
ncbi:hypothetical protein PENCOP_c013G08935 [Penicillium coprophilum]|uniref:Uncharacterized protein n=1 Tax=Penicillium coprophilum TaxID=36646 RepID=A0A1V6UBR4_9EURO|nr:hypothetical protein PENCOP_c013G08935 [Penicillium coprophilum]